MIEGLAPSLADFEAMAARAFERMPAQFRAACRDVVIRIADFAEEDDLSALGIDDPFELTGLYQGVDLAERSWGDSGRLPSCVWLYRRPILDEWCERGDVALFDLIAHVLVHELGHHLGLSDDDIDRIECASDFS